MGAFLVRPPQRLNTPSFTAINKATAPFPYSLSEFHHLGRTIQLPNLPIFFSFKANMDLKNEIIFLSMKKRGIRHTATESALSMSRAKCKIWDFQ